MKVAFIVTQFPSLSQTFILNQITGLIDRGCEVDIYARSRQKNRKTHPEVDKYKLLERTRYFKPQASSSSRLSRAIGHLGSLAYNFYRRPSRVLRALKVVKFGLTGKSLALFRRSIPFLDRGPYDIIHCQFGPNGVLATQLRDIGVLEGKIITHFRGFDSSSFVRKKGSTVYEGLFRKGDLILCVSETIRQRLIGLGCDEAKVMIHRSGVDLRDLSPAEPRPDKGIRLLTIARLVEKKGVRYGIEAVARLIPKYPNLQYGIVGDGPLRAKLESLIRQLHMDSHIKLLGGKSRDEVGRLLRDSDVMLTPSVTSEKGDEEGVPVAIMEAFAHGLPVVSTRHGGIPEIVHDGKSGFLVPERDPEAIADKLERLIKNPQLGGEMGRNGRRQVEEFHDIDKLNDRLVTIYERLCSNDHPSSASFCPRIA